MFLLLLIKTRLQVALHSLRDGEGFLGNALLRPRQLLRGRYGRLDLFFLSCFVASPCPDTARLFLLFLIFLSLLLGQLLKRSLLLECQLVPPLFDCLLEHLVLQFDEILLEAHAELPCEKVKSCVGRICLAKEPIRVVFIVLKVFLPAQLMIVRQLVGLESEFRLSSDTLLSVHVARTVDSTAAFRSESHGHNLVSNSLARVRRHRGLALQNLPCRLICNPLLASKRLVVSFLLKTFRFVGCFSLTPSLTTFA